MRMNYPTHHALLVGTSWMDGWIGGRGVGGGRVLRPPSWHDSPPINMPSQTYRLQWTRKRVVSTSSFPSPTTLSALQDVVSHKALLSRVRKYTTSPERETESKSETETEEFSANFHFRERRTKFSSNRAQPKFRAKRRFETGELIRDCIWGGILFEREGTAGTPSREVDSKHPSSPTPSPIHAEHLGLIEHSNLLRQLR